MPLARGMGLQSCLLNAEWQGRRWQAPRPPHYENWAVPPMPAVASAQAAIAPAFAAVAAAGQPPGPRPALRLGPNLRLTTRTPHPQPPTLPGYRRASVSRLGTGPPHSRHRLFLRIFPASCPVSLLTHPVCWVEAPPGQTYRHTAY